MIKRFVFSAVVSCIVITANAQSNQPEGLKNYLKQCSILLQDGGKWRTVNRNFDPKNEQSPNYYGYEYSKGINENTIYLKATGYFSKRSQWITFAEGFYTWDTKKQKVVYQSLNVETVIVSGQSESIDENSMSFVVTAVLPDGRSERYREIRKFTKDKIYSTNFKEKAGKWEMMDSFEFDKQEQPTGNLTFMSTRDGNFEIYSMDSKGENLKNLSCNKAIDYAFSYTPDKRLVFYTNRDGNDEIYVMEADGKKVTNLTNNPSADRIPCTSPDGKQILFLSDREDKNAKIYIMDIDGKNLLRLTSNGYFEDGPTWSPDGKKIIFTRELKDLKDTSRNVAGNGEIFIMDADGKNEVQLTNRPGYDGGPQISPDGKWIAFYGKSEKNKYDIFLMDIDGKNLINLTEDDVEDYSPSWSPDGKWIACTRGDSKNYDVWLIHLETGIKTRLTTQPKRDESPFWQVLK